VDEPVISRPHIPGYGLPTGEAGLLPWSEVVERLEAARHYWVVTASIDSPPRPHAVPIEAVWLDAALYFGGGDVRWVRNLRANPAVAVHLESGTEAVIVEGDVEWVTGPAALHKRIAKAAKEKYGYGQAAACWGLRPKIAFAWTNFGADPTRYRFPARPQ
jgi:hypothetical protein